MQVLCHHIYEYKKGLRHLVLHTIHSSFQEASEVKLRQQNIRYFIQSVNESRINIFFGNEDCVDVVCEMIDNKKLNQLTSEEDFILGTMLGYDRLQQCRRYLRKKEKDRNFLRKLFFLKRA